MSEIHVSMPRFQAEALVIELSGIVEGTLKPTPHTSDLLSRITQVLADTTPKESP